MKLPFLAARAVSFKLFPFTLPLLFISCLLRWHKLLSPPAGCGGTMKAMLVAIKQFYQILWRQETHLSKRDDTTDS
jgi:hypothetical protein